MNSDSVDLSHPFQLVSLRAPYMRSMWSVRVGRSGVTANEPGFGVGVSTTVSNTTMMEKRGGGGRCSVSELHHDQRGLSFSYVHVCPFYCCFSRYSGFRFRYCTALFWEDSNDPVLIYIAISRSYYIIPFVHLSLHKSHGMVYNHNHALLFLR